MSYQSLSEFDPNACTVAQAQHHIHTHLHPIKGVEKRALRQCLDAVLAQTIISPINVPAHRNSAMDGYAVSVDDLQITTPLLVVGTALAGKPWQGTLQKGQTIRIMTGAVIPLGAVAVVMQEQVEHCAEQHIMLLQTSKLGEHIREAGEDLRQGEPVLYQGRRITSADLGLIASLGIAELLVYRAVRVAFFSTGDELKSIGEPLSEGDIYDSNRYALHGMLTRAHVQLLDMGVIPDQPAALREALLLASQSADLVITTGGVSVGEADYIKALLTELGQINFWKINMKPGRPLAFGQIGSAWLFGLPGNPVSAMVTFYQFVLPALRQLAGEAQSEPITVRAQLIGDIKKRPGRVDFQRGIVKQQADGCLSVLPMGTQGSHILSSMSHANCFIICAQDSGNIQSGTWVDIQLFSGLI